MNEYAKKDSRIKVFHKLNGGASSARNYALDRIANEEWVSFIDIDDFISPYFHKAIVYAINKNPNVDYVRLVCTRTKRRYNDYLRAGWPQDKCGMFECNLSTKNEYFLQNNIGGFISSLFVRTSIIKDNMLRFDEDMNLLEDQLFSIKCAIKCKYILNLIKPNDYFYYIAHTAYVTKSSKDKRSDVIKCINRVYKFLDDNNESILIDKFFLNKWLPKKLDLFYSFSFNMRQKYNGLKLSDNISIRYRAFTLKLFVKMIMAKVLGLS